MASPQHHDESHDNTKNCVKHECGTVWDKRRQHNTHYNGGASTDTREKTVLGIKVVIHNAGGLVSAGLVDGGIDGR